MSDTILRRRDPEQRMARFYRVALQAHLFGGVDLVREWGRIGSTGTVRADPYGTEDEARAAAERVVERKRRRGYR